MCAPSDIFLGLLGVLFPPLPVWIKIGVCSCASLLNIVLCLLGYLPGLIHSWYIIASVPDPTVTAYYYEEIPSGRGGDIEAARANGSSRVPAHAPNGYVTPNQNGHQQQPAPVQVPPQERSYGTAAGAGEGSAQGGAPPSYDQAIRGDNKVQK